MLRFIEKKMTFKPDRLDHGALRARSHERVTFGTERGLVLDGAWLPASSSAAVLFIHGNKHNMTKFGEHYQLFAEIGLSCFAFDFPGYGRSTGAPSEDALYQSAHAAYAHLTTTLQYHPRDILVYGCSLGGAVAIELARHVQPAALITEATFTNTHEMGRFLLPYLPLWKLLPKRFENDRKVGQISTPHMIIHGEDDSIVPIHMAHSLFSLAHEPRHLVTVPKAGHTDSLTVGGDSLKDSIVGFTRAALNNY